jgi:hypothetical protein
MAGLVPAIHVFVSQTESKAWITGSSPVMTRESAASSIHLTILARPVRIAQIPPQDLP